MGDRPMLYAAPMVRAIIERRKWQTRRILKPVPKGIPWYWEGDDVDPTPGWFDGYEKGEEPCGAATYEINDPMRLRYTVGDRLYVREAWQLHDRASDVCTVVYAASINRSWTEAHEQFADSHAAGMAPKPFQSGWRPSIHMPRWASRITLVVTDVRVQRLQEIGRDDAIAEGVQRVGGGILRWENWSAAEGQSGTSPEAAFALLWNSINGPGAWDENPFVAAISFETHLCNIDALAGALPPQEGGAA